MKTPLAWLHLTHHKKRTAVAVAGVGFTVLMIFMQLGFFGSVEATATLVHDGLAFDILVVSRRYVNVTQAGTFPRGYLSRALEVNEVADAVPVYAGFQLWRSRDARRLRRQVLVLGVPCTEQVFTLPELQDALPRLQSHETVLTDRLCLPILGPMGPSPERAAGDLQETATVSEPPTPESTELGLVTVKVVGQFTLGTGFGADGMVVVSDRTFRQLFGGHPLRAVSLGLVRLKPGADPNVAAGELRRLFGADVDVLTRAEATVRERTYWVSTVPVGILFGVGVGVALVAGMVFLDQVISSDFRTHAAEYATLKAIGYRQSFLSRVVLQQALILAALGYLVALPASIALYELTRHFALIPISMNLNRAVLVLFLTALTCSISGLVCARKLHTTDPANLF